MIRRRNRLAVRVAFGVSASGAGGAAAVGAMGAGGGAGGTGGRAASAGGAGAVGSTGFGALSALVATCTGSGARLTAAARVAEVPAVQGRIVATPAETQCHSLAGRIADFASRSGSADQRGHELRQFLRIVGFGKDMDLLVGQRRRRAAPEHWMIGMPGRWRTAASITRSPDMSGRPRSTMMAASGASPATTSSAAWPVAASMQGRPDVPQRIDQDGADQKFVLSQQHARHAIPIGPIRPLWPDGAEA